MKLQTAFGEFSLTRWPVSSDRSLQAWDAADELMLSHLFEYQQNTLSNNPRILVCNDSQGALACALHMYTPVIWSDSCLSHEAIARNWRANDIVSIPDCLESIVSPTGEFDIVLIKVPKTYALLEDQLIRIRPLLHANTRVIAACMTRYLQRSAIAMFEHYLGDVSTSKAVKKARLVFCTPDMSRPLSNSPYPDSYHEPELNLTLSNHANLFCRDRLDLGARFFLQHLDKLPEAESVIDLACGNGVLGICLQQVQPQARMLFIDESYMATDSARYNYHRLVNEKRHDPVFLTGNGLQNVDSNSAQLIVCNPPFHTQHAVTADTARAFFKHSARVLCADSQHAGQLWVVANRHLRYRQDLSRYFKRCDVIASNTRFVLLRATQPLR